MSPDMVDATAPTAAIMTSQPPSTPPVSSSRVLAAYILGTAFFLYAFVHRVSPSIMTGELMRDFNANGAAIGALSSMYFYTYAALQIPVGVLVDRYGPRKLLALSAVVSAAASIGFAISPSVFAASVSRAFIGASVAFAFVGTLSIVTTFFKPARFAMLAGILLAVGMAGAMVGQAPLRLLVESAGWRGSYYVLAVWAVMMSVMAWVIVPRRPEAAKANNTKDRPMVAWPVFKCTNMAMRRYWIWIDCSYACVWWFVVSSMVDDGLRAISCRCKSTNIDHVRRLVGRVANSGLAIR